MSELRITETNSANDSKGRAFGLEGNDFMYVLIGFVVSLGLYLLLNVLFGAGRLAALMFALPFLLGPLGWVLFLRHNKPEGYAEDWFDQKFNGEGWSFVPQTQPTSPSIGHERRA
ncbi:MAG: PrgI family protein [Verrucomicrobiota bacterium]|nr:PrgI family protein [Verrucomicrobiota bacterium]